VSPELIERSYINLEKSIDSINKLSNQWGLINTRLERQRQFKQINIKLSARTG